MEKLIHKSIWIDNVKLIATISVIVLHVASPAVFTEYNSFSNDQSSWWAANFYDSFTRYCVPLFIMATGALLLPQKVGLKLFLEKRLKRILLPFIFWSGVYLLFNLGLKYRGTGIIRMDNFWQWLYVQIVQGPSVHLWYVYMIIGLYLFIPIIKPWIQQASNLAILYFLGIWMVTVIINQFQIVTIYTPFDIGYFGSYLGYLVLGYYLAERLIVTKGIKILAIGAFILGFLATLIGTFFASQQNNFFSDKWYQYLTINVVFASIGMYVFVKSWKPNFSLAPYITCRNFINKYGFGIYLGHVLILNILSHFGIDYCLTTPWLSIPLVAIICLIITCIMIYILDKLPYGKYVAR